MAVFPISGALDLYNGPPFHFIIDERDPDFRATGLTVTSFIDVEREFNLDLARVLRKRGRLEGQLLKRFQSW